MYDVDEIIRGIYLGVYKEETLPVEVYQYYASQLQRAVYKGYRKKLANLTVGTDEWNLLNYFRENVNVFSGAKTFQQIRDSQNFIFDKEGRIRPFNDYKKDVKEVDALYRESWLRTERDTAIAQGQNARKWIDIERQIDIFPYLIYRTQGDERVRHSHAALDGFTAQAKDVIWGSIMPVNSFNCRCYVEQVQQAEETSEYGKELIVKEYNTEVEPGKEISKISEIPDKLFKMNPAKDKIIFKNEGIGSHPYFKVGQAYEVLKTNNFNMDINYGV